MKLDHVILASNDNPDYLNFWPLVSEAWSQMGVDPILIYTGKAKKNLKGNKKEKGFNFYIKICIDNWLLTI